MPFVNAKGIFFCFLANVIPKNLKFNIFTDIKIGYP